MKALTVRQPWASLIVSGLKDVENRSWDVPSTLPEWGRCGGCGERLEPGEWSGDMHIAETGPRVEVVSDHAPECWGDCDRAGCPVPVQRELDPREPCGPVEPDGPFPFRLAVHAGARHDGNEFRRALLRATLLTGEGEPSNTMEWIHGWWGNRDGIGGYRALIGTVLVTGCHDSDACQVTDGLCSPWAETEYGVFHWVLADPIPCDPAPMRGRQGLWELPAEAVPA